MKEPCSRFHQTPPFPARRPPLRCGKARKPFILHPSVKAPSSRPAVSPALSAQPPHPVRSTLRSLPLPPCPLRPRPFHFSMMFFNAPLARRGGSACPPGHIGMMLSGRHAGLPLQLNEKSRVARCGRSAVSRRAVFRGDARLRAAVPPRAAARKNHINPSSAGAFPSASLPLTMQR